MRPRRFRTPPTFGKGRSPVTDANPWLVVAEVELDDEDEAVTLPEWLGEWYEVTSDARYTNATLARPDAEVPPLPLLPRVDD